MDKDKNVLSVCGMKTYIYNQGGIVRAVDDISFDVKRGTVFGLVGESGSGKSMTAYSIMGLLPCKSAKTIGGEINYRRSNDEIIDLRKLKPFGKEMRAIRSKEIALMFQDSLSCLNPVYTVGKQIVENIVFNLDVTKKEAKERTIDLIKEVKLSDPEKRFNQYPHELSGGMRQRILIAMALSTHPKVLMVDEPTSALDVTIKAQILDLFKEIQEKRDTAIVHITHDMGVMAQTADEIAVMYLGNIMEFSSVDNIFYNAKHPYTIKLLESIVRLGSRGKEIKSIEGSIPSFLDLNEGCRFYSRCPKRKSICEHEMPQYKCVGDNHYVKCWLYM